MLMFGTAAGPVPNKAELQEFFKVIKERLQRLYDVAYSRDRGALCRVGDAVLIAFVSTQIPC
jgi:hypothetical protein